MNIYNKVSQEDISTVDITDLLTELTHVILDLMQIVIKDESHFKNGSKKDLVELLVNIVSIKKERCISLNDDIRKILKELSSVMFTEWECYATNFMKIIQEILETENKRKDKQSKVNFSHYFNDFYEVLNRKVASLERFPSFAPYLTQSTITIDSRGVKVRKITMEHSPLFFSEIISHILLVFDSQYFDSEWISASIQTVFTKMLINFEKLPLEEVANSIADEYYNDLLSAINKSLTLYIKLYQRNNHNQQSLGRGNTQIKPLTIEYTKKLLEAVQEKMKEPNDLVSILVNLIKNSKLEKQKNLTECYHNLANYSQVFTDRVLANFDVLFGSKFFKTICPTWFMHEFVNISMQYIVAFTNLCQASKFQESNKPQDGNRPQEGPKLTFYHYSQHIENLIIFIFDSRLNCSNYRRCLEDIKKFVELIRKDWSESGPITKDMSPPGPNYLLEKSSRYQLFLQRILQKLLIQLKILRDNVKDLKDYMINCPVKLGTEKGTKLVEEKVFKEMPRYEDFGGDLPPSKVKEYFDRTESMLEEDSVFYYLNFQQAFKLSSLLEDREGIYINNCTLNPSYKLQLKEFLEETVFKRLIVLNDLMSLVLLELATVSTEPKKFTEPEMRPARLFRNAYKFTYNQEREYPILKKMYKYNIQIFMYMTQDHTFARDKWDSVKFNAAIFERVHKDGKEILMDKRQLYMMIEENLQYIFISMKNLIRSTDQFPTIFHVFFDCFTGTTLSPLNDKSAQLPAPGQEGDQKGLYAFCFMSELILKYSIVMFNEFPEKLDSYHFLYDKDINAHFLILKILKYFFRLVKAKEPNPPPTNNPAPAPVSLFHTLLIDFLQKHIFRLILVCIKLSITQSYPIDYLFLIKIILRAVNIESFTSFFRNEVRDKGIRIPDFFLHLFKSNQEELKIIAAEIVLNLPLELSYYVSRYPDSARDFIGLLAYALQLQQTLFVMEAIKVLDHILYSSNLMKEEIFHLIESNAPELLKNLYSLIANRKSRSYFKGPQSDPQQGSILNVIIACIKILSRIQPIVRHLHIKPEFKVNDDGIVALERNIPLIASNIDKLMSDSNRKGESDTEGGMENELENLSTSSDPTVSSMVDLEIKDPEGKRFKFNMMSTLTSIFHTIDVLKTKVTILGYYQISPNLYYLSAAKHIQGLERFITFLQRLMYGMLLIRNEDIEKYFALHAQHLKPFEPVPEVPEGWMQGLLILKQKCPTNKFLLQRIMSSVITILGMLSQYYSEEQGEGLYSGLKESIFALTYKSLQDTNTAPYVVRNMLCVFETLHSSISH